MGTDVVLKIETDSGAQSTYAGSLAGFDGTISLRGAGLQSFVNSGSPVDAAGVCFAVEGGHLSLGSGSRTIGALSVTSGGSAAIALAGENPASNGTLIIGSGALTLAGGSTLDLTLNLTQGMESSGAIQTDSAFYDGGTVNLTVAGIDGAIYFSAGRTLTLILVEAVDADVGEGVSLSLTDTSLVDKYFLDGLNLEVLGNNLVLTGTTAGDYYRRASLSHNGRAGAAILDALCAAANPQMYTPGSDAAGVMNALDQLIRSGQTAAADAAMAAVSGASATTLGMAFAADAQRHMSNIRSRLVTMKVDTISEPDADPVTGSVPAKSKPLSAWVNAEGSYQTIEQSGSAPGYSMDSWGGTLGIEYAVLQNLRCGLALTALYGDLDADAHDAASGDLDTCYISAFGQYRQSAWTHTLVASLGLSDISLERTMSHGMGSYRTSGETDGVSQGLLYELSYDIALNGASTTILQPLVNISYLHTTVDGYTETGSDAALSYGDQSMDSVSLGLGGRIQSLTGESVFNRSALIEGRVLAKFNCGDRRSTAGVGFANGIGLAGIESAAVGVLGVELGAGLTIPLGCETGSLFVDAGCELYREYSNLSASVGYRLSF